MAINDTHFFTVQGLLQGQIYVHTLHFREGVASLGTNPDQNLIDRWQTSSQTAWLNLHGPNYTLTRLTSQRICGSPPLPSRTEESVNTAGVRTVTGLGDPLAPWLCVAVNESSGLAGRSRHGRFFISGGYENDVNADSVSSTAGTWGGLVNSYVTTLMNTYVTGTPPLDWVLVVHSRKLALVPGSQCTDSSTPVTALAQTGRLTTQRSRRA